MSVGKPFGLPANWSWATVGDLVSRIEAGSSFRCLERPPEPGEPAIIKISAVTWGEFRPDQSKVVLERERLDPADRVIAGDFLFSRANTLELVGACVIACPHEQELYLSDKILRFRFAGEFKAWLLWWLRTPEGRRAIQESSSGNQLSMRNIGQQAIQALPVPFPPLPEQRRIVERIEALLAKGARAKAALDAIPALLDRYRQSLLAAAFRGDLTAEWRDRNPDTVSADALVARNAPPVQPRGGREATDAVILGRAALSVNHPGTEVPPGWSWTPLLRIARQETGHTPTRAKPEYWDGDVPWIGIRDAGAHHGQVIMDTAQHVTELGLENSSARLLPAGTVCLSRTASVGYVTIMGRAMATSQDFATWTCTPALLPKFLMYALMAEGEDIRRFGEGTTHTTIYFPEIRALNICLAPLDEQHEIVRLVEDGLARIDRIAAAVSSATDRHTTLTQSILAKAFRGELVPQDPADEPASVLLDRIRSQRAATPDRPRRGRRASAAS